ncbi:MAG TPA: MgtC/SapB family protein [Candidatus Paceibacterota bacterium]|nr:MgtC/SapB family protein [Candidatus Paceibacterota bacterium]
MFLAALSTNTMLLNLFVAMLLGMTLGIERYVAHKTAGMRTYTLISMGSALFTIVAQKLGMQFNNSIYQYYIIAQIITAAGFIGMGVVFHRIDSHETSGLTTASGLWVSAGIGMACGLGWYQLALVVTVLVLFTFIVLWFIEEQIGKLSISKRDEAIAQIKPESSFPIKHAEEKSKKPRTPRKKKVTELAEQ